METLAVDKLLEKCARHPRDEAAWEEFVRRYHSSIRASVHSAFHHEVREEAERGEPFSDERIDDLVNAVYVRLLIESPPILEGESENSIFQYLAMISTNVVRDYFREARAPRKPTVTYSLEELLESGDILHKIVTHKLGGTPPNDSA